MNLEDVPTGYDNFDKKTNDDKNCTNTMNITNSKIKQNNRL